MSKTEAEMLVRKLLDEGDIKQAVEIASTHGISVWISEDMAYELSRQGVQGRPMVL